MILWANIAEHINKTEGSKNEIVDNELSNFNVIEK